MRHIAAVLPEPQRQQLVELASHRGLLAAANVLGVSRQTYAVVAAGIPAHPAIVETVGTRLSLREATPR